MYLHVNNPLHFTPWLKANLERLCSYPHADSPGERGFNRDGHTSDTSHQCDWHLCSQNQALQVSLSVSLYSYHLGNSISLSYIADDE